MTARLRAAGHAVGDRAAEAAARRVAARLETALPELDVTARRDGVVLSGPGLAERLLRDARLRWIGGMLR